MILDETLDIQIIWHHQNAAFYRTTDLQQTAFRRKHTLSLIVIIWI